MKNEHLKQLLKECDDQISNATITKPDSSFLWVICLLFFAIILLPFLVFPLLAKIDSVRPYLNDIDITKFDNLLSKNSVHILFYALPAAIAVTHGISSSAWKTSISETMRLRLYKLAVLRVGAVLETKEWIENEEVRNLLLKNAFDVNLTTLTISEEKDKSIETGAPNIDILIKTVDKLEKIIATQSSALSKP